MRTFISHISSKLSTRFLAMFGTLMALAILLPAVAQAWGPDRPTFTQQVPASYITFNSITNNPKWGDERNFMRIRDIASGETFRDAANLQPGKQYEVIIIYHNNAAANLNLVAQNAYARTEIPAIVRSGQSNVKAMSYVGASNANPTSVYDHIDLSNSTNADIALRYVKGTAKIASNGAVNGTTISESLFGSNGTPLGYNSLNGQLPGCDQYSGYITYTLVADSPAFTFAKDVRLAGTKDWKDAITVNNGDKVEYRLAYKNTGTIEQKNVVFKDVLPQGINYVAGQTDLVNSNNPNGKRLDDSINGDGVNIGNYGPGGAGYLYLFGTVNATPCSVLTNTASVETTNGNIEDKATVQVAGNCAPVATTLPTTGPAEVIAGFIGIAAITVGVVYYLKSRKDLEDALHQAQSQPTATKTTEATSHHETVAKK